MLPFEQTITITLRQTLNGATVEATWPREEGSMIALRERTDEPRVIPFPAQGCRQPIAPRPILTLRDCWEQWIAADSRRSPNTLVDHRGSLTHWERLHGAIPIDSITAEHMERAAAELGEHTARKVLALVKQLLRLALKHRALDQLPEFPQLHIRRSQQLGRAVSIEEIDRLYQSCEAASWPVLGDLSPQFVWETWLILFWIYGARTQDFVGYKSSKCDGLLWSGVVFDTACPIYFNLAHPHGWLDYQPTKTRQSSGARVILPIHPILRPRLERFVGMDPRRVFPNGRSQVHFAQTWAAIRQRSGIQQDVTISGSGRRSIRKACNQNWNARYGGLGAYVLGHSPRGVNESHYEDWVRHAVRFIDQLQLPPSMQTTRQLQLPLT